MSTNYNQNWKPGDPIGYIRSEIPVFDLPSYRGESYEVLVPDTLDLAERATLAVHGMTEPTNPLADYEIYWLVFFRSTPPMMENNWVDHSITPKFQEALSLMRMMSGSEQNLHVERRWMEIMLKQQGPDGLIYIPVRGRPWAYHRNSDPWVHRLADVDQWIHPFTNGRTLSTMSLYSIRDSGTMWKEAIRRLVDGLIELAVDDGHGAYFWPSPLCGEKTHPTDVSPPVSHRHDAESSRVPLGLVHAYKQIDYEPALALARKLITYQVENFFTPDGTYLCLPNTPMNAHFHAHTHGLLSMMEYSLVTNDQELMEFVLKSYEYAKTQGNTLLGYFPEFANSPEYQTSEICEVSDMISLALRLSEEGVGDYWDEADRWVRNMFAEGQLLRTDWINRLPEAGWTKPQPRHAIPSQMDATFQSTDRVGECNLGAFAGWPAANDWYVGNGAGIMHCCTANGARALYLIWDRILTYKDGKLKVNLLLNRASRWADIDSYIPYQGRVEIKAKQSVDLSVRIPEWVTPKGTRVQVNGADRNIGWDGRYAQVGSLHPGNIATVTFPIAEQTEEVHVEKRRYVVVRKGNEVMAIDPPGKYCPLYQRQHYRDDNPRWRKVRRFVSNESLNWY